MNCHLPSALVACAAVLACGAPARSHADPGAAQTVTFCATGQSSAQPASDRPVHFPDTLRIVVDSRDSTPRRPEVDTAGAFITDCAWFWENDRLTFGSTSYFVFGPTIVAHGATDAEQAYVLVKYESYDGIPLYAYAEQMPEPSLLLAPEGLPCRFQPYTHEENVV